MPQIVAALSVGGFRSKVKILPSYYRLRGYVVCFRDTREKTHVSFYLIIFIPFRAVFSLLKILITILNILMKHCNGGRKMILNQMKRLNG